MSWNEEKGIYADKLEQTIEGIQKILELQGNRIVTAEMSSALRQLQGDANKLLPKLRKGEFEIAVVGLEKAGKSSFSNALIGLNALPTADERCTYTSTCVRPVERDGDEDYAEVKFYTRQEFDRSFREKLEVLGIPDAQLYNIDNLSLEKYHQLFEGCDDTKKQLYEQSLNRDIIDTLENKYELRQYIGSPDRKFSKSELKTPEFSSFITAPGQAMAVKDVVIYSTELRNMPNAVMYDVPGFNSPTAMHREQTLRKMQDADAIIMVAKANEPTLTADVLKIFQSSDVDGSYLSDKLFVFANKADLATDLEKNKTTTYSEWIERYKIMPSTSEGRGRIVFGSANACLGDEDARKKLGGNDGIEDLRNKLTTYYETARFEVLKKRVNKILVDIKKLFAGTEMIDSSPMDNTEKYEIVMSLQRELSENISKQLDVLKRNMNANAVEKHPLTTELSSRIHELVTEDRYQIKQDELERTHNENAGVGMAEQPQAIDSELRKQKFTKMYGDFVEEILACTDSYHANVHENILRIFLDAMHINSDSMKAKIIELCGLDNYGDNGYYLSLIERFARDVFEVQIRRSQGADRLRKFKEEATNFLSLGVFYCTSTSGSKLSYFQGANSPVWRLILYPENAYTAPKDQVIQNIQQMTGLKNVGDTISALIDRVMALKGSDTLDTIENVFLGFLAGGALPEAAVVSGVKEILTKILSGPDGDAASLLDEILNGSRYQDDLNKKHCNYSYEQVCQDFNDDIAALQLILQNAVVPAVNIDKAFCARETKLIEDIVGMLKGPEDKFISFIAQNAEVIKASKFGKLKDDEAQHAMDVAVMNEINKILSDLMEVKTAE